MDSKLPAGWEGVKKYNMQEQNYVLVWRAKLKCPSCPSQHEKRNLSERNGDVKLA